MVYSTLKYTGGVSKLEYTTGTVLHGHIRPIQGARVSSPGAPTRLGSTVASMIGLHDAITRLLRGGVYKLECTTGIVLVLHKTELRAYPVGHRLVWAPQQVP